MSKLSYRFWNSICTVERGELAQWGNFAHLFQTLRLYFSFPHETSPMAQILTKQSSMFWDDFRVVFELIRKYFITTIFTPKIGPKNHVKMGPSEFVLALRA
jgi:hypothetical protein